MSRIGKIPVTVPAGVKINVQPASVDVEGPKGKLSQHYTANVFIEVKDGLVHVTPTDETKAANAAQGLYRNLIHNMVVGVTDGFSRSLIINGVGYRAEVQGKMLVMNLGYSSDFIAVIPEGLTVAADGQGKITVSGIDKQLVGEFCAQIRKLRKPEPYKGKGIRYETETIRRKVGKSGVK
ncbi:50S ribosomal protein L6 [Treponema brennaborense]|uniref:Large ribosomal subunit protein uL6 n=1 Tax=Treponema brennaborense (strain DSM 12168 / CIP 105900 / DD5/3) TaxID=906968 RepID=F4LLP5_TREBD|nr:50S ribosomal protein L6 [Treponema brennaborense]AEE17689.1 ribosomal protein L6 [Treponema brennaborense DSM 12168]